MSSQSIKNIYLPLPTQIWPIIHFQVWSSSHSFVAAQLKHAIEFIGLDSSKYLGHTCSFRIGGAATEATKNGLSENFIQQLGRWQSNAIRIYIRILTGYYLFKGF